MERAQSSPPGGDGAERNFFRRNGGRIAPALAGIQSAPPEGRVQFPPDKMPKHTFPENRAYCIFRKSMLEWTRGNFSQFKNQTE